jgi:hypothetical protein
VVVTPEFPEVYEPNQETPKVPFPEPFLPPVSEDPIYKDRGGE